MLNRRRSGFTLIELTIIVMVIGILSVIVGLTVRHAGRESKNAAQKAHLQYLNWGTLAYQNDTGDFPATLEDLVVPEDEGPPGYHGPYFPPPVPKDPWSGLDYDYDTETGEVTAPIR